MALMQTAHPTLEQLAAFGRGQLDDEEHSVVERHVDACDECCAKLAALPDDTMLGLLRQPSGDTSLVPGAERPANSQTDHPTRRSLSAVAVGQ